MRRLPIEVIERPTHLVPKPGPQPTPETVAVRLTLKTGKAVRIELRPDLTLVRLRNRLHRDAQVRGVYARVYADGLTHAIAWYEKEKVK